MPKRQTPYAGSSPDWSHYRFTRRSGLRQWHFRQPRLAAGLHLALECLGWLIAFGALFLLFAIALGA
jgi:hypothetical protein